MSDEWPKISIIIPVPPEQTQAAAVEAIARLAYPADKLEGWLVHGRHPSIQRNRAAEKATGEWLYFLDDDSVPDSLGLREVKTYLQDPTVAVIGGPNLCPVEASTWQKAFALIMASLLAFGPSRSRYAPIGRARATTEKELILCNLLIRRELFLKEKGFDEALYPNEENALMDKIAAQGLKMIYHPQFAVRRFPRKSLPEFCRMLFRYGRGRAEQVRRHPTWGSLLNLAPPLFVLYILVVGYLPLWVGLPLILYSFAVLGQGLVWIAKEPFLPALFAIPLIPMAHIFYGLGFWKGALTRFERVPKATDVQLTQIR